MKTFYRYSNKEACPLADPFVENILHLPVLPCFLHGSRQLCPRLSGKDRFTRVMKTTKKIFFSGLLCLILWGLIELLSLAGYTLAHHQLFSKKEVKIHAASTYRTGRDRSD